MTSDARGLKIGYVAKMFPRLSETFVLNEILEIERRGAEVVIFSVKKPNEGRFHPQLSSLKARVLYLEDLDVKKWPVWLAREWPVLSPDRGNLFDLLGETLSGTSARPVEQIWWSAWVAAQAKKMGLSRLHAHFATLPSTITYLAHRISGIPFSFTAHAKDIFVYAPEEHGLPEKMAAASFVVTVTEFNRRYLLDRVPGIDPGKIKVIRNGVDLERFAPGEPAGRVDDLILGVGRLVPKKGFNTLLDACALLEKRGVPFRCEIVGSGPEAGALEEQRRSLGLEKCVQLVGPRNQQEVMERMRTATVFCLPCTVAADNNIDALPTVLLESLACGLPIVSTRLSGIPEIVDSGENGLLVAPEDPGALADELATLLTSPDQRARFGINGQKKARDAFDLRTNIGRLFSLYTGESGDSVSVAPSTRGPASPASPDAGETRRVLYLCADRGIPFGGTKGASIHIREFLEAIAHANYVPRVVVTKRDSRSAYAPDYPVHIIPGGQTKSFFEGARALGMGGLEDAKEFSRNEAVDSLLHDIWNETGFDCIYERYSLFSTAGRTFADKVGVPFVLEVNAPLIEEAPQYRRLEQIDLAKAVEAYLFSTADHIITVSAALRDYVMGIAPGAQVTVVPNGVNIGRFDHAAEPRSGAGFVVGFVGRVRPWHGVEILIDAVGELAKTDSSVSLRIVGNCGDAKRDLVQRCARAGLEERTVFTGAVTPDEVPQILQEIDVLAAPYPEHANFYFSPLKIFEYMASGRPIVASSIGQIPEILTDKSTALLVPPGDVAALTEALRRLSSDATLRETLGKNARAVAAQHHSWTQRASVIDAIIQSLMQVRGHADTIQTR